MDQILERYKYPIIGTIMVHMVFFMIMLFTGIVRQKTVIEGVSVSFEQIPNEIDKTENMDVEKSNTTEDAGTNTASNQGVENTNIKIEDYQSFEEKAQRELAAEIKAIEDGVSEELADEKNKRISSDPIIKENPNKSAKMDVPKEHVAYTGSANVSFILVNRFEVNLHVPVYLCEESGTVQVEIVVDRTGRITKVKVADNSKMISDCLQNAAISSAKKSKFNKKLTADEYQLGTITYNFIGQK